MSGGIVVALLASVPALGGEPCRVTLRPGDDVQRAIERAGRDGRPARVCLGPGEFRLERPLELDRDGVGLRGTGAATVVRLAHGVESPVIVVGDYRAATPRHPTRDVAVERLRVVGGGPGGRETHPDHPYLTNSAVVVRGGRRIALRDLEVTACRSACILTERDTRDVTIERNRLEGSVWDGLSLNRTTRARVTDNVIRGNTAAGITAEHLDASVVAHNVLQENETHGIYLSDSHRNVVAGNRIVDNVLSGVFLTCAVRQVAPVITCWRNSMSQGNAFTRNVFAGNRVAYTWAPNAGAACTGPGFVANRSRDDRFAGNARFEAGPPSLGRCLRFGGALSRPRRSCRARRCRWR